MRIKTTLIFSLFAFTLLAQNKLETKNILVDFYSEFLLVEYSPRMLLNGNVKSNGYNKKKKKSNLEVFYNLMETPDYQPLLNSLFLYKDSLELNDWLFYSLLKKSVKHIFAQHSEKIQTLICWQFLSKAGFDARITYSDKSLFLNVYTEDDVFETPLIKENDKTFINLSQINQNHSHSENLYLANFIPNPTGKKFSFDLAKLPRLSPKIIPKKIKFAGSDKDYSFDIHLDKTVMEVMKNYPFIAEDKYLEIPLSTTLANSILPPLKKIISNKTKKESIEFLIALTRTGFDYKTDEELYGKSKPMIADELFHYKFSDCEDRSALFYALGKELIDLPMVVIAYEDHITIGIASGEELGEGIDYEGRKYFICDPTGPRNSYQIGIIPSGYENQSFEIIAKYK